MIVSDQAGTTRDTTDTEIHNAQGDFLFIDTAGLRRKSKVEDSIKQSPSLVSLLDDIRRMIKNPT